LEFCKRAAHKPLFADEPLFALANVFSSARGQGEAARVTYFIQAFANLQCACYFPLGRANLKLTNRQTFGTSKRTNEQTNDIC
jgi:hypothetical protein